MKKSGGEYKWKYGFVNPQMQPYVIMKGLNAKRITQDQLRQLEGPGAIEPSGQRRLC